ncbi:SanA/YdcF family protein [Asanoa iriomotensis]|uniref:SanA/YdcF family protein n=1 Tax=Asanoa iriomotensis TaxID=234613 RepID=UPI0027E4318E|nr:ElyC/SanA/YdcF family protein [Asanoa iriomotensis]
MPRRRRRWLWISVIAAAATAVVAAAAVLGAGLWLRAGARGHVYSLADVPSAPVVMVLGAQVYPDGTPSPFLAARLDLARQLYDAGTVRAVLVSGDHREWHYDEPGAMSRWLVERGVPERRIVQDHAGFDTYDSCVRAKKIFGVDRMIVVTQQFHIDRAVALCRDAGIETVGVGDETVKRFGRAWDYGAFREQLAGVKAAWDVVTGRDPVFLGPRETGVEDALAN